MKEVGNVRRCAGACRGQTYQSDSDMIAETLQAAALTKLQPNAPTKLPKLTHPFT